MNKFINDIFITLNDSCNYALLRNKEDVVNAVCRDIDILIDRNDYNKATSYLKEIIEKHSFKIITTDKRQYMNFWGLLRIIDGKIETIAFDFIFDIHVYDIVLFDTKQILSRKIKYGEIYHTRIDDEFITKYITCRLWRSEYPSKYQSIQNIALESYAVEIDQDLKKLIGNTYSSWNKFEVTNPTKLISAIRKNQFRKQPITSLFRRIKYFLLILRRMLYSNGVSLAFTGSDGAGKTTIIDLISAKFKKISHVVSFHHRPTIIGNISQTAVKYGLKDNFDHNYNKPHRGTRKGKINSILRLCYYTIDYIIGFWLKVKPNLAKGRFVIFDRYYTDIIVDSRRSSIYLGHKFLHRWGRVFIPKMRYNFLITANPEVILSRKQELDHKAIESINSKMELLTKKKRCYMIENNGSAEEAVTKILLIVIEKQHKRIMKKI